MTRIPNAGTRGRTWLWLGVAAAIVAIAVFRIRLDTVWYLGFFLGIPFVLMRMHGGGHGGGQGGGQGGGLGCGGGHGSNGASSERDDPTRGSGEGSAGHRH